MRLGVLAAGRHTLGTRGRRWLVVVTLLLGAAAAVAVAAATPPSERTFASISGPAQLLMSATVPFLGVLLVNELRDPVSRREVLSTVAAAVGLALLIAAFGVLVCAIVTALVPSTGSAGRWENAGVVALGSLLVQGTAQLVGTGLGLLLRRRPALACLATIVLPLGLWRLFGAVDVLRPLQAWSTPYPSAQHLLSGELSAANWAQWLVVLAVWGVGLNALGVARATRPSHNWSHETH